MEWHSSRKVSMMRLRVASSASLAKAWTFSVISSMIQGIKLLEDVRKTEWNVDGSSSMGNADGIYAYQPRLSILT